jgi:hypothetical protein
VRRTNRFLRTVVEVVPEGRSDLGLELKGCNELASVHHQHVPELGWAEITWQGQHAALNVNVSHGEAIALDQGKNKGEEAVHVLARCDRTACACIDLAQSDLLFDGGGPISPKELYGFPCTILIIHQVQRHAEASPPIIRSSAMLNP